MGACMGMFHLIKQMLGYEAASAFSIQVKEIFDHFQHHERVRHTLKLHCSRHHEEHGAFSNLFSGFAIQQKPFCRSWPAKFQGQNNGAGLAQGCAINQR